LIWILSSFYTLSRKNHLFLGKNQVLDPDVDPHIFQIQTLDPDEMDADPKPLFKYLGRTIFIRCYIFSLLFDAVLRIPIILSADPDSFFFFIRIPDPQH